MDFNGQALTARLCGRRIGGKVHFFDEISSTNDFVYRLGIEGAPEGTVAVADHQTKGKGRLNRVWQSPPKANLYTTILLRPAIEAAVAAQITLLAGVAVADVLSRYCPGVTLKWPNDVRIRGRKVCGILTEMKAAGARVDFAVVGIGVNINMKKDDLDEAFRNISTTLREEVGHPVSRLDLAVALYEDLDKLYGRYLSEGFEPIRTLWTAYADILGKPIQVVFGDEIQQGEVLGIDESGALLLSDGQGGTKRILAGDASVVKNP
jgi:BirA family biotin operon repressor/biotin-[acetyl-CoA-carboxylase] ligase